jgi:hypothetical protein
VSDSAGSGSRLQAAPATGAAPNPADANAADEGQRTVPYLCPFCGEEDLRPADQGRWHCRSCLRVFSLRFHGLAEPQSFTIPTDRPSEWSD